MSESLKISTVNNKSAVNQTKLAENKEKKKLLNREFTTTEKVIGGLSALAVLGLGTYAMIKKRTTPKIKQAIEKEIQHASTTTAAEAVKEVPKYTINEQKTELLQSAIKSIKDFKKIGRFENGKAILNSGEPFSGQMLTNHPQGGDLKYLIEYKDGVICERSLMEIPEKGTAYVYENFKYKNGKLAEKLEYNHLEGVPDYITKYTQDLDGNRVTEHCRISNNELKLRKRITHTGINTIFEKFRKDKILRVVQDKKGHASAFIEDIKSGNITPISNKYEEIFKDSKGIPKYSIHHKYDTLEFEPYNYIKVYGKDGETVVCKLDEYNMEFAIPLPKGVKDNISSYKNATYNIRDKFILVYEPGVIGLPKTYEVTGSYSTLHIKERDFRGGANSPFEKIGTYDTETGEISCDEFFEKDVKFSERIKEIVERIYGKEKPVPPMELYEQKLKQIEQLTNDKSLTREKVELPWGRII